jgi:photosystem II stability/assembly factor-like uncharacterized protein
MSARRALRRATVVSVVFIACLLAPSAALAVSNAFFDVDFVDANHGWIVGTDKQILRTINGGKTWTVQKRVLGETPIESVCFCDRSHGWAVGYDCVFRTTNGGKTWLRVRSMTFSPGTEFMSVKFRSRTKGWMCGGVASEPNPWGGVYGTTDGGRTWSLQASWPDTCPMGLDFVNAYTGIVTGVTMRSDAGGTHCTPFAAFTSDGVSWQDPVTQLSLQPCYGYARGVDWARGGHIATVGGYDTGPLTGQSTVFWSSTYGGAFGEVLPAPGPNKLNGVTLTTGLVGYAVGDGDRSVLKTVDGGATWVRKATIYGRHLFDVDFVSTSTGYAVGQTNAGGLLAIKTTNGGRTWTRVR